MWPPSRHFWSYGRDKSTLAAHPHGNHRQHSARVECHLPPHQAGYVLAFPTKQKSRQCDAFVSPQQRPQSCHGCVHRLPLLPWPYSPDPSMRIQPEGFFVRPLASCCSRPRPIWHLWLLHGTKVPLPVPAARGSVRVSQAGAAPRQRGSQQLPVICQPLFWNPSLFRKAANRMSARGYSTHNLGKVKAALTGQAGAKPGGRSGAEDEAKQQARQSSEDYRKKHTVPHHLIKLTRLVIPL